jgi:membrane-associated phospholipid phosphatase
MPTRTIAVLVLAVASAAAAGAAGADDHVRALPTAGVPGTYYRYDAAAVSALQALPAPLWDAKYSYWTRRPFMRDPALQPSFPTPNFPSYPSGHAAVSAAAATVLGHHFPDEADRWMTMAEEARDSRLWSGLHFPVDNDQGFLMGQAIAAAALRRH